MPDDRGPAGGGRPPGPAGGAAAAGPDADLDDAEFDGVTEAEMRAELDEARRRLAEVPAAQVVANHAMGCWELAAIHLSAQPPAFAEAQVAIDGMTAIVETLQGRLGENEPTLRDALSQLRMAYVQLKGAAEASGATEE